MHRADTTTPFHIDLEWWAQTGRNLRRFLATILEDDDAALVEPVALDYIDRETAEVSMIDSLWVRVLVERAQRPDYITSATPLTNAILRALVENLNRPMTPVQLHRRVSRSSPEAILRVLSTARTTYGIVSAHQPAPSGRGRSA
jgi:hypothetical protein